jgi:CRISPR-associated endonuclease/helicase Cas3
VKFFAHSTHKPDKSDWQSLASHLTVVGELAAAKASIFGAEALATVSGRLHDLGKYTLEFQRRLEGAATRVDHSTWGARVANERYKNIGQLLAYGIAGHHAGLANGQGQSGERTALQDRLAGELPTLDPAWQHEIELPVELLLPTRFKAHSKHRGQFQLAFLTRMLFSCLVDADFLDTEAFYDLIDGRQSKRQGEVPTLQALRDHLDVFLSTLSTQGEVNGIRQEILGHVRSEARHLPGLFSLAVPTGGGKTLASLAFALDHAIQNGLRRVICVIPFTSVVEQNAAVFRRALGELGDRAVLEHHSGFIEQPAPPSDPDRYQSTQKLKMAMENWDAPIVVTTAVQFFESLFASRPSQCRKLHNIAGSVIILDEAQTLPLKVLRPCVAAIDELARNYRCSVVLCTATQPALEAPTFAGGLENVRELAPMRDDLFHRLRRVRVQNIGTLSDEAVTDQMRGREQVLCIVNNRRHARAIYQSMQDLPGARHLTTLMCAKHRSVVLAEVRQMLKDGQPCRLVSTSLIEAGVDVDFPTVLRAEAGLDSIAQAAGRCNREGRHSPDASEVLVFMTANEDWAPPPELKQFAQAAREALRQHPDDPLSPTTIERYFRLLYWQRGEQELDAHNLLGILQSSRIDSLPLETLATKFRFIENVQFPVIIPFDDPASAALRDLEFVDSVGGIARRLQPYIVQLPRQGYDALKRVGAIQPAAHEKFGEQFMWLMNKSLYSKNVGLDWSDPIFMKAESLVF